MNFLGDYLRSHIHLVAITPDGPIEGRWFGDDAFSADTWSKTQNAAGRNIYWTVNFVTPGLNKKPTKADLIGIRCAHVDIDPPRDAPWDKATRLADLMARGQPSAVIDSGNGLQGLWWINTPTDIETIEAANRGLELGFKADHCWNADRLLRLPGLINYPDAKKRAVGRVPVPTGIIVPWTGRSYTPSHISQYFPAPPRVDATAVVGDGPVPEWNGYKDDEELIGKMVASRGGMNAAFGVKARVEHLWNASRFADVMMQMFPSTGGDVYDRSAADASLMAHLAFWTGKDAARMDRLFRRSDLMRPKYQDRPAYRSETIRKAIEGCSQVYDLAKVEGTVAEPVTVSTSEFLIIPDMVKHFAGCVYVENAHRVMVPGGRLLKPEQFKVMYGGKEFQMQADSARPSRDAFEAFTQNRAYRFPKVFKTCFKPQEEPGAIIGDAVNVYYPDPCVRQAGDPAPFLDLLSKMFPDERDRTIVLSYLAGIVQHIGVKFQWAIVLQGAEGNGKGFIQSAMKYVIGKKYTHTPAAEDLGNQFNAFLEHKLLINVEEFHMQGRREILDTLKPLITSDEAETQPKGVDKRMVDNVSNWIFSTNHRDAVIVNNGARRYAIFFTAQQTVEDIQRAGMSGDYFPKLWNWANSGGFAIITDFLANFVIPAEFNPHPNFTPRAPVTSTTAEAITASLGRAEQWIMEAIEDGDMGFRNKWISSHAVVVLLREHNIRLSPQKIRPMVEALGYRMVERCTRPIMQEDLKRPVVFCHGSIYQRELTQYDYEASQGYPAVPAGGNVRTLRPQ